MAVLEDAQVKSWRLVLLPYGYYESKLGWGALGAFDPTAPFTPPAGWTVDREPVLVTAENQAEFATGSDAIANCGVKVLADQIPTPGGGGGYVYAPLIGWYAVNLTRAVGNAGEVQYATDRVWIDPSSGKRYQIEACTESVASGGAAESTMTPGQETWTPVKADASGLLVTAAVIGGGLLLMKLFKKRSGVGGRAAARRASGRRTPNGRRQTRR